MHPGPSDILAPLNPTQREIVTCCDGPMLVLAGAGSGKTMAVTHKIAWLLTQARLLPGSLLAVTFTNKAASQMRERVGKLVGPAAEALEMGTFHSVSARFLRRHADKLGYTSNFLIFDPSDSAILMRQVLTELGLDKKEHAPKALVGQYDSLRSRNVSPEAWVRRSLEQARRREQALAAFKRFEEGKKKLNAMDFNDLLQNMVRVLQEFEEVRRGYQERFKYVLVDEMQDTNFAQMELLKGLVGPERRICAVGDDDQSIYAWRGARVDNMLDFANVFAGTRLVRMEQNYRSTRLILAAANSVIAHNDRRHAKSLWTENDAGERIRLVTCDSEGDEAYRVAREIKDLCRQGMPRRQVAVFFRTNAQSRSFEEAFGRFGIPHVVVGGTRFYERAEVKDTLAYLRVVANPADDVSLLRIINKPARGIGETAIEKLRQEAAVRSLPLLETARQVTGEEEPPRWGRAMAPFVALVAKWQHDLAKLMVHELAEAVLRDSGYLGHLNEEGSVEAESRKENLGELVASMVKFGDERGAEALGVYLEQVALVTDIDLWRDEQDFVPMMTVHMAKGLEFDRVFVTGMEEGLFPHANHDSREELEEERRLFYVALTRARRGVVLTNARTRARFGEWSDQTLSRFVNDIDPEVIRREEGRSRGTFFDAFKRHTGSRPAVRVRPAPVSSLPTGTLVRHATHGVGRIVAEAGVREEPHLLVHFDSREILVCPLAELETIPDGPAPR